MYYDLRPVRFVGSFSRQLCSVAFKDGDYFLVSWLSVADLQNDLGVSVVFLYPKTIQSYFFGG